MKFEYPLSVCVIAFGICVAAPTTAIAQQQGVNDLAADDAVPEGYIVVKMLPPLEATAAVKSKAPRRITDRRDPEYVRCRIEPVAGSLVTKRKICMTNHEWALAVRKGNQYAREFVDDNQPGFMLQ